MDRFLLIFSFSFASSSTYFTHGLSLCSAAAAASCLEARVPDRPCPTFDYFQSLVAREFVELRSGPAFPGQLDFLRRKVSLNLIIEEDFLKLFMIQIK